MTPQEQQERIADAGEYVVGTLTDDERRTFEAQLQADVTLQREVYAWQDRLLGLTARLAPQAVPVQLWARIAARLGSAPIQPAHPAAANDPLWSGLRFWQALSGVAVAASLVLGTVLLTSRSTDPIQDAAHRAQAPRFLAVLQSPDKAAAGWLVETVAAVGPGEAAIRLVPLGPDDVIPAGKTMQFWTKPQGAQGPTSLGLVRPGQVVVVPVSKLPGLADQTLFELTLEPAGGSPYSKPSGPILYVGRAVKV